MTDRNDESDRRAFEAGWQTMDTAPKDGTEILGFGPAAMWGRKYAPGRHVCWWDEEGARWQGRDPDVNMSLHLTHWMPLPKPPEATTAPKPFTFADPAAQREHERIRAESRRERE